MRPYWDDSRSRPGLVHGFLSNLCTAVTSCFYVFCCCWLVEDCCMGRRSFPRPLFESPPPPPPPVIGHQHHGLLDSIIGGPSGPPPPPPPVIGHQHHGLLGSIIGGPPSPPGPFSYAGGGPTPFG